MGIFATIGVLIFTFHYLVVVCNAFTFPTHIKPDFEEFLKGFNSPYGSDLNGRPWSTVFSRTGELLEEKDEPDFIWNDVETVPPSQVGEKPEKIEVKRKGIVSFGGFEKGAEAIMNEYRNRPENRRPVILLHGISHGAEQMGRTAKYLISKGYKWHEIYGFTWGRQAGRPNKNDDKMECDNVKQVRVFILAVLAYTGAKAVNVVGLSTGVLLARKAILGGKCVDDKDFDLGGPLTNKIETFIGVSGPNRGSLVCKVLGKILKNFLTDYQSCNLLDGFHPDSKFITDINEYYDSQPHVPANAPPLPGSGLAKKPNYEGKHVFSIITPIDKRVYFHMQQDKGAFANGCLIKHSEIIKEDGHARVLYKSKELILKLLQHPTQSTQICAGEVPAVEISKAGSESDSGSDDDPVKTRKWKIDPQMIFAHTMVTAYYYLKKLQRSPEYTGSRNPNPNQTTSQKLLAAVRSVKEDAVEAIAQTIGSLDPAIPATIG